MPNETTSEKPETTSMTVDRDFAKRLKMIADHHEITMGEAVERFGGAAILREYKKVLEEKNAEIAPVITRS